MYVHILTALVMNRFKGPLARTRKPHSAPGDRIAERGHGIGGREKEPFGICTESAAER